jgi:hypothetical protein
VLGNAIATHSYWSDATNSGPVTSRSGLRKKVDEYPGLEYAMSEYAILGSYDPGHDLGIDPALHNGLAVTDFNQGGLLDIAAAIAND